MAVRRTTEYERKRSFDKTPEPRDSRRGKRPKAKARAAKSKSKKKEGK